MFCQHRDLLEIHCWISFVVWLAKLLGIILSMSYIMKIEIDNGVDCKVIVEYVLLKWMNDCTNHLMMSYYIKWHKFFCIFDYFKRLLQNCTTAYFPLVIQSVSFCFIFSSMPFRKPVTTSAFYKKNIITLHITIWPPIL